MGDVWSLQAPSKNKKTRVLLDSFIGDQMAGSRDRMRNGASETMRTVDGWDDDTDRNVN